MLNLPLVPVFASILRIPYYVMYPAIVVVSVVGVYSINNSMFDVGLLVASGLLGYVMRKTDLPTAPLVLAFVLGPLFEQAVRRSLIISQGELQIFVTRPWSLVFLVVTVVLAVGPAVAALRGKKPLIEVEADE
jgi:putative tricarboxylic transport membrane protein